MGNSLKSRTDQASARRVAANEDQFGEHRGLGVSEITFKVTPRDNDGIFSIENTFHEKGGPAKHLHYDQDEWFYAVEGNFILEVGQDKFNLAPGDSILAPRRIPHVWAYTGGERGRILIAFMPAGKWKLSFAMSQKPMPCHLKTLNYGGPMAWSYLDRL